MKKILIFAIVAISLLLSGCTKNNTSSDDEYSKDNIVDSNPIEVNVSPESKTVNSESTISENNDNVNTGQGFVSEAGLPFLKEHIDVYRDWQFVNPDGSYNQIGCPKVATDLFKTKGIKLDGTEQIVCDVHIYPAEYFNPYDSITGKLSKTNNTYSIHWYDASWSDKSTRQLKFNRLVRRIIGTDVVKKLEEIIK